MNSAAITSNATVSEAAINMSLAFPMANGFIAIGSLTTYNSSFIKITREYEPINFKETLSMTFKISFSFSYSSLIK